MKKIFHGNIKFNWVEREEKRLNSNKEYNKECKRKWREKNRERDRKNNREYEKKRRKIDPQFKLNKDTSSSIRRSLKENKAGKHWEDLVGYSLQDLIDRLSVNFQKGMTWDNYGKWHVDHKKPVSAFNFKSPEDKEFKECWSLCNLQPLWAEDNFKKGNRY